MILVTGGTGLVGSHLLYKLISNNERVKAIYRTERKFDIVKRVFSYYTKNVDKLFNTIDWVKADLNDVPALTDAFKDVTHVYHCAAFVSFEPDKYHLLRRTNIEGTANMVNLSIAHGVEKFCFVSSIAALGEPINNNIITEETHWNPDADNSVYAITKYGAEMEVWRAAQEGLNVVIVNPGVILGSGIWRYGSGNLFKRVYNGTKYYTKGTIGVVAIEDVTKIMIQLMKSKIINERFLLVAENWTYKDFLIRVAKQLNVKPPKKEAKSWLLRLSWRLDWLKHKFTGKRRVLTKQLANSLFSQNQYENSKITKTLDYSFVPVKQSIENISKLYLKDVSSV